VPGDGSVDHGVLAPDGVHVYCRSDVDREYAALLAVPLAGGPGTVLAERETAELQDVALAPDGARLGLLWNVDGGRSAVSVLDLPTGQEREVGPLPRDVVDDCCLSPDGAHLLLTGESWSDARGVWSVDLASGSASPVSSGGSSRLRSSRGASTSGVDVRELAAPQLHRLPARDGLELSGWLYPTHGPAPWPTVIHLHGGPEAQERPVYNSLFQSLSAAGVAVFAPNVRGSSGFGRTFVHADDLDRRFGSVEDVAACVEYLATSALADAGRIGCMGRSYGGYLTLAALVHFPELFAVGVDVCGMADFETFYQRTEPWIAAAAVSEYGDPHRDRDLLRRLSPIHRIDRLRAPLLVVHGAEDTNVPVFEAEQVVAALARRGAEHSYLLFEGEGHELLETTNRVAFVQATVSWVTRHLAVTPGRPLQDGADPSTEPGRVAAAG
jgi:dipeptidyl aminopeptidase/acylaminoacyl peptidase